MGTKNKIFILSLLLLLSCGNPKFVLDTQKVSFRQLLDYVENEQQQVKALQAVSRITIDSKEFSGHFYANILYRQSDSLLVTVNGLFGLDAGNLFIGKDRFIFYNQITNKFYNGSVQDFKSRRFMQFPLSISELSNILLGKENFTIMKIIDYSVQQNSFLIKAQNGDLNYNIWIDNRTGHIFKLHAYKLDQLLFTREYGDFIRQNGIYFPRKIIMNQVEEHQSIAVYYTELKINKEINPHKFDIKISDTAQQIDISLSQENNKQE
jgi:hypothetical protein